MNNLTQTLQKIKDQTRDGKYCPAHKDNNPSFNVSISPDNTRILVNCFAGCSFSDILNHLDGVEAQDFFAESNDVHEIHEVCSYEYHNEDHDVLYTVKRLSDKSFPVERPGGLKGLGNCERVPYRLPELLKGIKKGKAILFVEGEKDTDAAFEFGFIATTIQGGNWHDDYLKYFKGAEIFCIPDLDKPGLKKMEKIFDQLKTVAASVKWLQLPGEISEKNGKDLSDWIESVGDPDELFDLMLSASSSVDHINDIENQINGSELKVITSAELIQMDVPENEYLLDPILREQGLAMIYAIRGIGKTWFALQMANAVATGDHFLMWKAKKPSEVLYIDGEMPLKLIKDRITQINNSSINASSNLKLLTPDCQTYGIPDLSIPENQKLIEQQITTDTKLIIIDSLSTLIRSGDENDSRHWIPVQEWLLRLRSMGKSVLIIHHAGKSGAQRGTSKREDVLDTVIELKKPKDYCGTDGAHFEVHFQKARSLYGDQVQPFEAKLETLDGKGTWTTKLIRARTLEQVMELKDAKMNPKEIAEELGISVRMVYKHLNNGVQTALN